MRRDPSARLRVVSLERALSKLGFASRVESRALIEAGRVRVGTAVVRDPARRVDPDRDRIAVDGVRIEPVPHVWWMLHKPLGCVTTRRDPEGRPTVYDCLPAGLPYLAPVGRLDADSTGLLLFTNDTRAAARLADPAGHVEKVYEVTLEVPLDAAARRRIADGIVLDGRRTRPAHVARRPADPLRLRIVLTEGRNRQVRRMVAAAGGAVRALHRTRIGPLALGGLPAGAARPLAPHEVMSLVESVRAAVGPRVTASRREPPRRPPDRGSGRARARDRRAPRR